jgi:dinuclear metal center YbgI/SA1388 family protein
MTSLRTVPELAQYLDRYLRTTEIPDAAGALNGLQVENSGRLLRILGAVDACQAAIDAAVGRGAGLLLVHHGLFWNAPERLTGRTGRRIRTLITHDVAVYAAHIPLDCHPEVGNNAVLARELGLESLTPFGRYEGVEIGWMGLANVPLAELARLLEERIGARPRVIATGPDPVQRVAVVTGAAGNLIAEAHERGVDTFITGEVPHHAYFDAEEFGLNLILGGHYATETVGVEALGEHLRDRFGLEFEFFDHPTGL